jgi:hypothetical protein
MGESQDRSIRETKEHVWNVAVHMGAFIVMVPYQVPKDLDQVLVCEDGT